MSAPKKPSDVAFEGRTTQMNTGGFTEAETKSKLVTKSPSGKRFSSYPHLSPLTGTRAAHVTDISHVATIVGPGAGERYNVHQRYHQDDVAGSTPVHDRYIATDSKGVVHNVQASLNPNVHQPKNAKVPSRGDTVSDTRAKTLSFTLGALSGDPPLSPRSTKRTGFGY